MPMTEAPTVPTFESYGNYASSNYGVNALVFTDERGRDFYFSYRTLVAFRIPGYGLVVRANSWGPTTGKHLNWIDGGSAAAKRSRRSSEGFGEALAEATA